MSPSDVHRLWKRQAKKAKDEGFVERIEHEIEHDVDVIADSTGMKTWQVFALIGIFLLALAGLLGWCGWRFLRKKRKPKEEAKKDVRDDEDALVANDEKELEEEAEKKPATEYLGKLQYELKYDFNTQTLTVKVIQATDLPAMDLGGVSDPYVKVYLLPESKGQKKVRMTSTDLARSIHEYYHP